MSSVVAPKPALAERIVCAARELLGVPFLHQGRDPAIGLDCVGVAIAAARACGVQVIDRLGYGRTPIGDEVGSGPSGGLLGAIDEQPVLRRVRRTPRAGDVLVLRFARLPQHVAICAGETMIHGWESVGRCVEHPLDAIWRRRVVAVAEFVEADDGADAGGWVDSDASDDGGPSAGART